MVVYYHYFLCVLYLIYIEKERRILISLEEQKVDQAIAGVGAQLEVLVGALTVLIGANKNTAFRAGQPTLVSPDLLAETEERQDGDHHHDQPDDIDDVVHSALLGSDSASVCLRYGGSNVPGVKRFVATSNRKS